MMNLVNQNRTQKPAQDRKLHRECVDVLGNIRLMVFGVFDRIRMLVYHVAELRSFSKEQDDLRRDRLDAEMHDAQGTWTMKTAFYATGGSCVYRSKYTTGKTMITLEFETLKFLATEEPETLLPVKIAASQNPGQSSGIAKTIICFQAAWFCSQCISRMSSGMAISLLELNTFAHCVSALFIYGFWWHKPHDTNSHVFVQSEMPDFVFLKHTAVKAIQPRRRKDTVRLYAYNSSEARVCLGDVRVCLERAHSNPEENNIFFKMADKDMVPGTGFSFHIPGHRSTRFFLLPKDSLAHWQRLWRFTVETSIAIASVDPQNALLQSERRSKNMEGGDIFVMMTSPAAGSSSMDSFTSLILGNIAFVSYGGLHLLAWRYHFRSTAESILWKMAGVLTTSSGAVPLVLASAGMVCQD
jgi:hypothetical protein